MPFLSYEAGADHTPAGGRAGEEGTPKAFLSPAAPGGWSRRREAPAERLSIGPPQPVAEGSGRPQASRPS